METIDLRPSCFIASSTHGLKTARQVEKFFGSTLDVELWTGAFDLNDSAIDTLLQRSAFHDYAIVVVTPDDPAEVRGETVLLPRDNVLFELGLFLGSLGKSRAFPLIHTGAAIPTDWSGVTVAYHSGTPATVRRACEKIMQSIEETERMSPPVYRPSTALAHGYWANFIQPTLAALDRATVDHRSVQLRRRDNDGPYENFDWPLERDHWQLEIRLPDDLAALENSALGRRVSSEGLEQATLPGNGRDFTLYYDPQSLGNGRLHLVDYAKTMAASQIVLNKMFEERVLEGKQQRDWLERREMRHFHRTLAELAKSFISEGLVSLVPIARA